MFTGMWQTVVSLLLEGNFSEWSSDKKGDFFPELRDIQEQLSVTEKVRPQHSHYLQVTFSLEASHRQQSDLQGFGFPASLYAETGLQPGVWRSPGMRPHLNHLQATYHPTTTERPATLVFKPLYNPLQIRTSQRTVYPMYYKPVDVCLLGVMQLWLMSLMFLMLSC